MHLCRCAKPMKHFILTVLRVNRILEVQANSKMRFGLAGLTRLAGQFKEFGHLALMDQILMLLTDLLRGM